MECAPWITKARTESTHVTNAQQSRVLQLLRQGCDTDFELWKTGEFDWIMLGTILAVLKNDDQIMIIRRNGVRHYRIITNVTTNLV